MRVLIYGGGAVGLGLASCLLKSEARATPRRSRDLPRQSRVDIISRTDTVLSLRKSGLTRKGIFGNYHAEPSEFGSFSSLDDAPTEAYDYILVCTKSFDSFHAAKDLSGRKAMFGESTKIVLFQNGWANADIFTSFFAKEIIYSARVITGFHRYKPNEVTITVHADAIHIGSLFGEDISKVEKLSESISNGGIPCETTADIEKDLWAKMLYNCALNPLGAILDVPYGKLAEQEYSRNIMDKIVTEVFDVMTEAGFRTHWETAVDFLDIFYGKLVPDTAGHKSSMLQDITAKKPTEIDALNGAVIRLAEKFAVPVPYNSIVYNIIKFIEAKNPKESRTSENRTSE
jgi:2-dehydropantoate 2-reductase